MSYNIKDKDSPNGLLRVSGIWPSLFHRLNPNHFKLTTDPIAEQTTLSLQDSITDPLNKIGDDDISAISPTKKTLTDAVNHLAKKTKQYDTMADAMYDPTLKDGDEFVVEEWGDTGLPLLFQDDVDGTLAACDAEYSKGPFADLARPAASATVGELHGMHNGLNLRVATLEEKAEEIPFIRVTCVLPPVSITTTSYTSVPLMAYIPGGTTPISYSLCVNNSDDMYVADYRFTDPTTPSTFSLKIKGAVNTSLIPKVFLTCVDSTKVSEMTVSI